MDQILRCCNGTYRRTAEGWRYPWGSPVPGAVDLTLADLMAIGGADDLHDSVLSFRALTPAEERWLLGESNALDQVLVRRRGGRQPHIGDLVVGMMAPELHVVAMMTVGDIAESAGVSKATIDSYRYRGYLPAPQAVRGRTPLWARPIVRYWLASRPGPGWRTDIYQHRGDGWEDPPLAAAG